MLSAEEVMWEDSVARVAEVQVERVAEVQGVNKAREAGEGGTMKWAMTRRGERVGGPP